MAFKTFAAGDVLTASDLNTYLMKQSVIVCTSATRPGSPPEGMTIYETDTDLMKTYNGSSWLDTADVIDGTWTSYTPTLGVTSGGAWTYGTPTISTSYTRVGKTVFYRGSITWGAGVVAGAGSSTATLPITAATTPSVFASNGIGWMADTSGGIESALKVEVYTSTTMRFSAWTAGRNVRTVDFNGLSTGYTGGGGNIWYDTGDVWYWTLCYEAA